MILSYFTLGTIKRLTGRLCGLMWAKTVTKLGRKDKPWSSFRHHHGISELIEESFIKVKFWRSIIGNCLDSEVLEYLSDIWTFAESRLSLSWWGSVRFCLPTCAPTSWSCMYGVTSCSCMCGVEDLDNWCCWQGSPSGIVGKTPGVGRWWDMFLGYG